MESIAIEGAAWGTNAAFGIAAGLNVFYISKYTSYRISIGELIKILGAVSFMGASAYGAHYALLPIVGNEMAVLGAILVALVLYGGSVFALGIVVWDELLSLPVIGKIFAKIRNKKYE